MTLGDEAAFLLVSHEDTKMEFCSAPSRNIFVSSCEPSSAPLCRSYLCAFAPLRELNQETSAGSRSTTSKSSSSAAISSERWHLSASRQ